MAVVSVCLNLPWTEVNPYMSRSMVLFGLLIGIANGCNTFGADSIYGKHHDVEFEDIRIQSDYLKIIALQKDSLVKRTTLKDRILNDKYLATNVKHQSFYLFEYPMEVRSNGPIRLRAKQMFYERNDGTVEHFRIASNGNLLHVPSLDMSKYQVDQWGYSFVLFDPSAMKDIGPLYMCHGVELVFNESLAQFAVAASKENPMLQISGQKSQVDAVYRTEDGIKSSRILGLVAGGPYGLTGWSLLTDDGCAYLVFKKRSNTKAVDLLGKKYWLTNNLCAIESPLNADPRVIYTKHWVARAERINGELFFLADNSTQSAGKPVVFDEQGHEFLFPGSLATSYRTINWDVKRRRIAFAQVSPISDSDEITKPISIILWDYTQGRINELEFDSESIKALAKD